MKRSWLAEVTQLSRRKELNETSTQASLFTSCPFHWISLEIQMNNFIFFIVPTTSDPSSNTKFWHIIFPTYPQSHFPHCYSLSHSKSSSHTFLFHDLNLRSYLLQTALYCLVVTIIFYLRHELRPLPKTDPSDQASSSYSEQIWWPRCNGATTPQFKTLLSFKSLCWALSQKEIRC